MGQTYRIIKKEIMRLGLIISCLFAGVVHAGAQPLPLDYSFCGYHQSEETIPSARNVVYVQVRSGDNATRIQRALDYVATLKPDKKTGLRGAVLLSVGTFEISTPLRINASGVVLRGSDKNKTILLKTGIDRGAAVYMEGKDDRRMGDTLWITDATVKAGCRTLSVSGSLKVGQEVMITRPSTIEWIRALDCESFGGGKELGYWGWHPGDIDITWDRTTTMPTAMETGGVQLDAPLTTALDSKYGKSYIIPYTWKGRIHDCGVENLTIQSTYDTQYPKDEDHCWDGIYIANAKDCWVRMASFAHLSGSAVIIHRGAEQITVEDCVSREPVSEIGGMRRRTFYTLGEKCLFQRCYSEQGINDFAAGFCAAGPNAFVQCESKESLGFSGSISSWASGLLFDCVNIDGNDLVFRNLELDKYGAGWNTGNSTLWQCTASGIDCYQSGDDASNVAYGCWGQFKGNGTFEQVNEHVKPYSIYADLLQKRLNRDVSEQCRVLERNTNASSSPSMEEAQQMTQEALRPRLTMRMWIDSARFVRSVSPKGCQYVDELKIASDNTSGDEILSTPVISIKDGRLVNQNALMTGGKEQSPWWNGRLRYTAIPKAKYGITRFVPGSEGYGLTDRIDSVVAQMNREHTLMLSQNYGLWYDRRRDDHERIRRKNGDVWGPFYEQPFARSGISTAWDGLSKYDLNRLNKWYFYRLNEFATQALPKGILLFNEHYFQHNILEAGAHWVDCPWRSANNINHTGFPEPVPFTGDKRIFTAQRFYDISNDTLRQLHRQYIRMTLDALKDHPNVIHSIGEEFTGPLHFVRFWLDCISEWEKNTGEKALIALAVNKDVQDSILQDKQRSQVVNIIDIEQWFYHNKGIYAPPGGVNLAPRQYARKIKAGQARFEDVYRAVLEYRKMYPDKAVVYYAQKYPELGWAVLMAGGSCPVVPITQQDILQSTANMKPMMMPDDSQTYVLGSNNELLVYKLDHAGVTLPATNHIAYQVYEIDAQSGTTVSKATWTADKPFTGKGIFWLKRK